MCEVNGILMVFGRPIVLLLSCASADANEERVCVSYREVEYKSPNEEQRVCLLLNLRKTSIRFFSLWVSEKKIHEKISILYATLFGRRRLNHHDAGGEHR